MKGVHERTRKYVLESVKDKRDKKNTVFRNERGYGGDAKIDFRIFGCGRNDTISDMM